MISIEQETIFLKALKLKRLAEQGVDGEKVNAVTAYNTFCTTNRVDNSALQTFEEKTKTGIRVVYEGLVFYDDKELVTWLKTKSFSQQAKAFFIILKNLLQEKFKQR